jgi:hypothetical protein
VKRVRRHGAPFSNCDAIVSLLGLIIIHMRQMKNSESSAARSTITGPTNRFWADLTSDLNTCHTAGIGSPQIQFNDSK